jgi:hypothetical protein
MPELRPFQPPPQRSPAPGADGDPALRANIAERLRRVCDDMTPEAFDALVDRIHAMKVRWRGHGGPYYDD